MEPAFAKYHLISEIIGTQADTDPGFLFEDLEELDSDLLCEHEKGIKFNKDYILSFWQEMDSKPITGNWDIRYNKPHLKCWTSRNGSKFDSRQICIRVEATFDKKYDYDTLVRTIVEVTQRKKWDGNIAKTNHLHKLARNAIILHCISAKLPVISIRDVLEKKFLLNLNNKPGEEEVL